MLPFEPHGKNRDRYDLPQVRQQIEIEMASFEGEIVLLQGKEK